MNVSTKIALVVVALVFVSATIPASLLYWRYYERLIQAGVADVAAEARVKRTENIERTNELMRDVLFISRAPPVSGIIRAVNNNGVDPLDSSTLEQWQNRFAELLGNLIGSKPLYLSGTFFRLDDNSKKLIEVNRKDELVVALPSNQLSEFNKPFDVRSVVEPLNGQPSVLDVYLETENGEIVFPYTTLADAVAPVYDQKGALFGAVVITINLDSLLHQLVKPSSEERHYYVSSREFNYLRHPTGVYLLGVPHEGVTKSAGQDFPMLPAFATSGQTQAAYALRDQDKVLSITRIDYGPKIANRRAFLIIEDSFSQVTQLNREVFSQLAILIGVVMLVTLIVGIWLASAVTRPFDKLNQAVSRIDTKNADWQKPEGLSGEAAMLANALDKTFDELKTITESLKASNRELEQFAYIASHDLQEPLRTITSFSGMIEKRYAEELDDKAKQSFQYITQACLRMRALIHGLLEYSRLGRDLKAEQVDCNQLVADVLADLSEALESSNAEVAVAELPNLRVYSFELHSLFQNIISNAIKYVEDGVSPNITINASPENGGWTFAIEDNGLGINPEYRERIFLIFQRLHGQSAYGGTGIGLANCVKIVELHGGKIWVEDAPSGGSIFYFWIKEVKDND